MSYHKKHRNRRSVRLKGYDYSSPGEYFITICTQNRECLFGDVVDGKMVLNEFGKIAHDKWLKTESIRDNVELDLFIIMPNHMHAIFGITLGAYGNTPSYGNRPPHRNTPSHGNEIKSSTGAYRDTPLRGGENKPLDGADISHPRDETNKFQSPSKTVGAIVRGYKSSVTAQINKIRNTRGQKVWQRNYYEHIIRNDKSLNRIRDYIINNPMQWHEDRNCPGNILNKSS